MVNLQSIDLSSNALTGSLIDFSTLPSINLISINNNYLNGHISDSILNISSLKSLRLSANSFTGRLSSSFCYVNNETLTLSISSNPDLCYPSCWTSTHPLDDNDACATSSRDSFWTTNVIVGFSVGGCLLLVIVYLIFDNFYRQKELILKDKKQQDRLMLLPIHKMLRLGRNYDDKYLNNVIMKNLNTAKEFDYENMSVMELIFTTQGALDKITRETLYAVALRCLPFDKEAEYIGETDECRRGYGWCKMVQCDAKKVTPESYMKVIEVVKKDLQKKKWKKKISVLATCLDRDLRRSIDIASKDCKEIMQSNLFFVRTIRGLGTCQA